MSGNLGAHKGIQDATNQVVQEWASSLKKLLEEKHLYQNTLAAIPKIKTEMVGRILDGQIAAYDSALKLWESRRLQPAMKVQQETTTVGGSSTVISAPTLLLLNVKLFCKVCDAPEVFAPLWGKDAAAECKDHQGNVMPRFDSSQLFFLAFQCQRCVGDPEGFIVRRKMFKLFLEGRSPIEEVAIAKYLPKSEAHFFSDAIIAFNAGKKLAGLFYLRVFLEQFAKRVTGTEGRITGENLMDSYAATLPIAHRDHMPSFRHWYERLSVALHNATEDDALFEEAKSEIDRHFDIRRIFRISEEPT